MTEAVVFDMDGVIFDSEALVIKTWEAVAEKHGFSDVEQVCRKCLGTNAAATRQIFLDFYGEDFPYDEYKKEKKNEIIQRSDNPLEQLFSLKEANKQRLNNEHYINFR